MIFQHTWQLILDGKKTQTRRVRADSDYVAIFDSTQDEIDYLNGTPRNQGVMAVSKNGNIRVKWQVGKDYAVQARRGLPCVLVCEIPALPTMANIYGWEDIDNKHWPWRELRIRITEIRADTYRTSPKRTRKRRASAVSMNTALSGKASTRAGVRGGKITRSCGLLHSK